MSQRQLHKCLHSTCAVLLHSGGWCPKHKMPESREGASERGYDRKWAALQAEVIREHYACQRCNQRPAQMVHHLIPVRKNPKLRLVKSNLQALCYQCHEQITKRR